MGDVEKAFARFQEGNHLKGAKSGCDLSQDDQQFIDIREQFNQADLRSLVSAAKSFSTSQVPIFILGMPCSGTTLVEQIISSHSQVFGGGELSSLEKGIQASGLLSNSIIQKMEELKGNCLICLKKLKCSERPTTDKVPHNFRWIGWICIALPEAKIIRVKRSAMATCWSIYKHYFPRGHGYSCNLIDLGSYCKMYMNLMEYWREKFPQKIYELNYEKLTQDQEQRTRKLLAHLGLTCENACLAPEKNKRLVRSASNQQVSEPTYQGSSEN